MLRDLPATSARTHDGSFAGFNLVRVVCPKNHLLGTVRRVAPVGRLWQIFATMDPSLELMTKHINGRRPTMRRADMDIIDFAPERGDEGAFDLHCRRCGGTRQPLNRDQLRAAADKAEQENRVVRIRR